jgi:hypothetical protein
VRTALQRSSFCAIDPGGRGRYDVTHNTRYAHADMPLARLTASQHLT